MMGQLLHRVLIAWKLIWTLAVRELVSMFRVPAGWIIIALFAFLSAVLFVNQTLIPGEPGSMRYFFTASAWLLIPIAPAISMRLMSEEYRTGSFESLRTTPAGDWAVAIGKYIGSVLFLALMLTPSLAYPIVLMIVSNPAPDPGPTVAGYLMLLLVGSLYLGVGLLASSTTSSQTLAFLGTMMALVIIMVITSVLAPRAGATLGPILGKLSVITRAAEMGKGVIDSATVAFFIITSIWMVVLTAGVLESRRLARSRWSLIIMGTVFFLATGAAALFAGVLTNDHHFRIDATSTSAHKLSPRATNMVRALPDQTRIILAINQTQADRRSLDLVSDVLETYDRSSDLLSAQIIDLSTIEGTTQIQSIVSDLRARDALSIEQRTQSISEITTEISSASAQLLNTTPQLATIRDAMDPSTPAGKTNRAFFEQRGSLVRIGAQDLESVSRALSTQPDEIQTQTAEGLINTQLVQLEDLRAQLGTFSTAPEISPVARAAAKVLSTTLDSIIDTLAINADRLARLPVIDADRVQTALQTGEALLIVGPPDLGIAAVDLDALLPSAQILENAGISPAGVIGPRAQELIASALGQLIIRAHPIVVFVHAGEPGQLLSTPNLLNQTIQRFNQRGIDAVEWAALQETDQPSLASIDPLGQRPVVYMIIGADSAAGGGDTGITGARRSTALASITKQLIDQGESVLVSINPSIFGSIGDNDPIIAALNPFGIVPDPTRTLLTQKLQSATQTASSSAKQTADPVTLVLPSVGDDGDTHPIGHAVAGLSTVLPWSVPMTIDPRVGVETQPILKLAGTKNIWAEHDWLDLWSTPAQSRQYLRDQPVFDESDDLRRDDWILASGAERIVGTSDTQRVIVVGSNSWIYDALTFNQTQLVDGRITTAFPGNLALLESSIAWLAGLDDLIAPGIESRPIATIKPMSNSQLSTYRWILLLGIPAGILVLGVGSRIVFG